MWAGPATQITLPISASPAVQLNFGAYIRDLYRLHFAHELAAGTVHPLIIPYSVLGAFILPILYFTIPHVNRPWLFRARYLLMAFIVWFNFREVRTSSSVNFAVGYAVGLAQAWGVLWSAALLVWMSPQFEAERVEKRKRRVGRENGAVSNGHAGGTNGHVQANVGQNAHASENGNGDALTAALDRTVESFKSDTTTAIAQVGKAPDEDTARSLAEGYEYYWQAYPADAPFSTRLDWSVDLVCSFRGTGWNWCVPILPHFAKPEKPFSGALVDLESIPLITRQGYRRYRSTSEWLHAKLPAMALSYLLLDLLSVLMMKDPYFILGPELALSSPLPLPFYLAPLPGPALFIYRGLACFLAILLAIDLILTTYQIFAHLCLHRVLGARSELWHFPCIYGGFTHGVLDKGLVGFWGAWWHQTFRIAFSAPSVWLARHRYLNPRSATGKAVAGLLAFLQSGFLHTGGSISCLPPSKPWGPPAFFLLCWVGILVQTTAVVVLRHLGVVERTPVGVRRATNLVFVLAWLLSSQFLFSDDLARGGIWLLEPVPASVFRALGYGRPGDVWWRWDSTLWPRWWTGKHWWESGIAL